MKQLWIVNSCTDKYPNLMGRNGYNAQDGWDEFRNSAASYGVIFTTPLTLRSWINDTKNGPVTDMIFERRVPKAVTTKLHNGGTAFTCPCWFVFVTYANGVKACFHITKTAIKI